MCNQAKYSTILERSFHLRGGYAGGRMSCSDPRDLPSSFWPCWSLYRSHGNRHQNRYSVASFICFASSLLHCTYMKPISFSEGDLFLIDQWYLTDPKDKNLSSFVHLPGDCHRADHLLEHAIEAALDDKKNPLQDEQREEARDVLARVGELDSDQLEKYLKKYGVKAPETKNDLSKPFPFNLMFKTSIGPKGDSVGYLRPETAQGIFVNFRYECSLWPNLSVSLLIWGAQLYSSKVQDVSINRIYT